MEDTNNISLIDQYVIDFVRKLRVEKNLRQEDIAYIIGTKRTFVTNVESLKNRAKYNLDHLNKLADHFGISPRLFLPEKAL